MAPLCLMNEPMLSCWLYRHPAIHHQPPFPALPVPLRALCCVLLSPDCLSPPGLSVAIPSVWNAHHRLPLGAPEPLGNQGVAPSCPCQDPPTTSALYGQTAPSSPIRNSALRVLPLFPLHSILALLQPHAPPPPCTLRGLSSHRSYFYLLVFYLPPAAGQGMQGLLRSVQNPQKGS